MVLGPYLWKRLQGPELDFKAPWVPFQKTLYGANVIIFEGIMAFADKTLLEVRACWEHPSTGFPKHNSFSNVLPHPHSLHDLSISVPVMPLWMSPTWCVLCTCSCSLSLAS